MNIVILVFAVKWPQMKTLRFVTRLTLWQQRDLEFYYFLEDNLTVILCICRFISLQMNLVDLSEIKKKDNLLISYPGSFLRCICLRTGRSLVYWCNWNSCHRPASTLCIRQRLQKRKWQIKNKEVEKKHNTNPTRLKIAVLQLTSGLHVAVSQHGCSWNDRRQPVFAVTPLFTRFYFIARLSRHLRNWTYGSCKGYDNTQTWSEAQ